MDMDLSRHTGTSLAAERTLAYARWAGAAVAALQVLIYTPEPTSRPYIISGTVVLAGALAAANLALVGALRRGRTPAWVGSAMFAVDVLVVCGLVWLYLDEPAATQWVLFLIVQLEAAYRWDLRGAIGTALGTSLFYALVWFDASARFGFAYDASYVSYVVGISLVQAIVVGGMARRLRSERDAQARLHQAALALTAGFERQSILDAVVSEAKEISGAELAVLWTPDPDGGFVGEATTGLPGTDGPPAAIPAVDPVYGESSVAAAFRDDAVVVRSGPSGPDPAARESLVLPAVWTQVYSVAVGGEEGPVGVLSCYLGDPPRSGSDELAARLRSLAALATLALRNAVVYQRERSAVEALRDLDRLKDDFLSTVSHELRTPLTVVQGFATTLRDRWEELPDDRRRDLVRRIEGQATGLHERIGDLLDFSRLQSGQLRLDPEAVDLERAVSEIASRLEPTVGPRPVEIEVPAGTSVWADPIALAQILDNLLVNAARYSDPGSTITVRGIDGGDGFTELTVVDRGIGIPPDELDRIFERFYRGRGEEVRRVRGTGVGLAIVKDLVEAQGGTIRVESTPGDGSTFTVRMPASQEADQAASPAADTNTP